MSWLLLTLSAAFIATAAAQNKTFSPRSFPPDVNFGVVEVHSLTDGFLCRGIIIRHFTALTVGDCVAYSQRPYSLFVRIYNPDFAPGHFSTASLVHKVDLHPKFRSGEQIYNLALLTYYVSPYKKIVNFEVPETEYSTKDIIDKKFPPFVTYYRPLPRAADAFVALDYLFCNEDKLIDKTYCVGAKPLAIFYSRRDFGTPFYITVDKKMFAVGMYMGQNVAQATEGHLFVSLQPAASWISGILKQHGTPPSP